MKKPIKIAIADDHQMFREGLISRFKEYEELEVIFDVSNGVELLEQCKKRKPDVILMDLQMPEMDGFDATEKVIQKYPEINVLVVSTHNEETFIRHLLKRGARGFILKEQSTETIVDAVYSVLETGYYFNDNVTKAMLKGFLVQENVKPTFQKANLTQREMEVVRLMSKEYTTREIADKLFVSTRTIDGHKERILEKTKTRNAVGIIMYAIKNNLLEI